MGDLWRRLNRFEEEPWLLRAAQTWWGKAVLLALFGGLFRAVYLPYWVPGRNSWAEIMAAAAACSLAGRYRRPVLALTTLALLLLAPDWYPAYWLEKLAHREPRWGDSVTSIRYGLMAGVLVASALLILARRRFPRSGPARWPVLSLLMLYAVLLGLACSGWLSSPARVGAFALLWALSAYLWYLAYALRDANSKNSSPLWFQLATFHPYFSGSWIPIGLGAANLRRCEVRDAPGLAVCQLKGLKLMGHCWLLYWLQKGMVWLRLGWGVPTFHVLLRQQLDGTSLYPRTVCWGSLLYSFFEGLVEAYALGNLFVACARLGGFQILQQVYKPLGAGSVVEFWNRISYYYKQVVVELFFYPSFLGYFKKKPRLRQAFAVFMAAGVGNLCYHFRSLLGQVARQGLEPTLRGMQTYVCYCIVLCCALFLSQLRLEARPTRPGLLGRCATLAWIVLFYSLLSVFDVLYTVHSPLEHLAFVGYLFGL